MAAVYHLVCQPLWQITSQNSPIYSAFGKYSDPLTYSTLCYFTAVFENGLNCLFLHTINPYTIPHNDKAKNRFLKCWKIYKKNTKTEISHLHKYSDPLLSTLLKHLWQRLQPQVFLGMMLQARHTCICGVSLILLCRSSQALSGWMGSVAAQLFS
jgi:hypothetical protein